MEGQAPHLDSAELAQSRKSLILEEDVGGGKVLIIISLNKLLKIKMCVLYFVIKRIKII